jgi:hypothetical protein
MASHSGSGPICPAVINLVTLSLSAIGHDIFRRVNTAGMAAAPKRRQHHERSSNLADDIESDESNDQGDFELLKSPLDR